MSITIDDQKRSVVGLAIRPNGVEVCRLNLHGNLIGDVKRQNISDAGEIVKSAAKLLEGVIDGWTLAIGLSTPGFVDPESHRILFSSVFPGHGDMSLESVYEVAGELPMMLDNDMHAMAARWMLTHQQNGGKDVLLVYFEDGQLGAAMLIDGRPNRGCSIGANELGHLRLPVETDVCYCGQKGCLERICSTSFVKRYDDEVKNSSLLERAMGFDSGDKGMEKMIELLGMGLSGVVNFMRPNRVVLASELIRYGGFADELVRAIRSRVLIELIDRVRIDLWDQPAARDSETAGWLALASVYRPDWNVRFSARKSKIAPNSGY